MTNITWPAGSEEAAAYLGLSVSALKYHIYTAKTIKPFKTVGKTLLFDQEELDRFLATKRSQGRPRKTSN